MIDLPLIFNKRTHFSDECYGIIGRALAFATSFECNCKALEALIEMQSGLDFSDKKYIAEFNRKFEKKLLGSRMNAIQKALKKGAMDLAKNGDNTLENEDHKLGTITNKDLSLLALDSVKTLGEKFEDARNARNDIAHNVTKGIGHGVENDKGREGIIKNVETLVRRVAATDVEVYNLCRILTKGSRLNDTDNYCETAVKWVCEMEDTC